MRSIPLLTEVDNLTQQLHSVGLPAEISDVVVRKMEEFADTGVGFSETIKIPGTRIGIVCLLSNQAHITSSIRITRV